MTTQEMIIGVNLEAQKINSNFTASYQDEEIIWLLNDEQIRFMKNRIKEFQEGQKRLDDLQNLIVPLILPAYGLGTTEDYVWSYLPHDYFHLVSDRSLTKDLCGEAYAPGVSDTSFYIGDYQLPTLSLANYQYVQLSLNSVVIFMTSTYYPTGLPDALARFDLWNLIIEVINRQTKIGVTNAPDCKYESWRGRYKNDGIQIGRDTAFTFSFSSTSTPSFTAMTVNNVVTKAMNAVAGSKEYENRLTKGNELYKVLNSAIAGTLPSSPVSEIRDGKLYVWHKKKFIVSSIKIDYIRRPRKISVALGQGCELNENVHAEIVSNTAKRIAGLTRSEVYPNLINENLLKE